ncbi:MAG: hypothetical protein J5547_01860, partial [Clostridia bacterium]|nr:hypothetical protein [Clostridia bacterium]
NAHIHRRARARVPGLRYRPQTAQRQKSGKVDELEDELERLRKRVAEMENQENAPGGSNGAGEQ